MKEMIKVMLEKATPGPYYADTEEWPGNSNLKYWVQTHDDGVGAFVRHDDAIIAANAPECLRWQNERIEQLEKALEFYADTKNYARTEEERQQGYAQEVMWDRGIKARQALGKE